MFIRVQTVNRLIPIWKTTSYINLSNVIRIDIEKNHVNLYSPFRPWGSFYQVRFDTPQEAESFVEQCVPSPQVPVVQLAPSFQSRPDPLAVQAMADWEEERKLK